MKLVSSYNRCCFMVDIIFAHYSWSGYQGWFCDVSGEVEYSSGEM
jgi:hypothetical protein